MGRGILVGRFFTLAGRGYTTKGGGAAKYATPVLFREDLE